jgi:hypothetical protein
MSILGEDLNRVFMQEPLFFEPAAMRSFLNIASLGWHLVR